jgi:hypothetical protein
VEPAAQTQFDQAKAANQLPSLRSLTGQFSAEATRADLSYTEAYSVVDFMIKTYGRDKMTTLLLDLKDGQTMDQALQAVYGFNSDGLENAWRSSIGAKPLSGASQATQVPTPTIVPTYVPISAAPVASAAISTPNPTPANAAAIPVTATPTGLPTSSAPSGAPPGAANPPGLNMGGITTALEVGLACLVIVVLLAGLVIFLIVRGQNRSRK